MQGRRLFLAPTPRNTTSRMLGLAPGTVASSSGTMVSGFGQLPSPHIAAGPFPHSAVRAAPPFATDTSLCPAAAASFDFHLLALQFKSTFGPFPPDFPSALLLWLVGSWICPRTFAGPAQAPLGCALELDLPRWLAVRSLCFCGPVWRLPQWLGSNRLRPYPGQ
jgi:hypothetical protein